MVNKESTGQSDFTFGIDSSFDDETDGVTQLEAVAPHIKLALNKTSNQATATITRLQNYNGRASARVVWSDEIESEVGNLYTIVPPNLDPGEGQPLAAGHFILVYEE